jgi:TPR repeat protein
MIKSTSKKHDLLDEAHKAFEAGHSKLGFDITKRALESGDLSALNALAYCYDTGAGVSTDKAKALKLYKQSIRSSPDERSGSASNIAIIYREMGNTGLSRFWFKKAVAFGDVEAGIELVKLSSLRTTVQIGDAIQLVSRVIAEPRMFVTEAGREEAENLLKQLHASLAQSTK